MDLLKACDELKAVVNSAQLVVNAWRTDPDDYSELKDKLEELEFELIRIGHDK